METLIRQVPLMEMNVAIGGTHNEEDIGIIKAFPMWIMRSCHESPAQ